MTVPVQKKSFTYGNFKKEFKAKKSPKTKPKNREEKPPTKKSKNTKPKTPKSPPQKPLK